MKGDAETHQRDDRIREAKRRDGEATGGEDARDREVRLGLRPALGTLRTGGTRPTNDRWWHVWAVVREADGLLVHRFVGETPDEVLAIQTANRYPTAAIVTGRQSVRSYNNFKAIPKTGTIT